MDDFSRYLFETAAASARALAPAKDDAPRCPSCGGDVNVIDRDDETCGALHCREAWYGQIWERN